MKVLITGFAGTIGSEFTKQLLGAGHDVVGVDNCEWAVAQMEKHPHLEMVMGDFGFVTGKYDLIIHCAAYKHVDLIENNKVAAYENNVFKTDRLYNATKGHVLFISTDKAVEPVSFYGLIKQEGEQLTAERGGIIARLGNIMGSNGSVIPKWEKCIEEGKPLPITDPEMTRYMIPVDRAVSRVLALLPKADPEQVIIPEMGEPIGLLDLAKQVCDKHKIELKYEIVGIRPGEKVHEQLRWDREEIVYQDKNGIIVI